MKKLNREDLLTHRAPKLVEIPCDELGGVVVVKALTSAEKDRFEVEWVRRTELGVHSDNIRAFFLQHHIVDPETNDRMFGPEDLDELGELPGLDADKIFTVCKKISGLSDDDEAELKKK